MYYGNGEKSEWSASAARGLKFLSTFIELHEDQRGQFRLNSDFSKAFNIGANWPQTTLIMTILLIPDLLFADDVSLVAHAERALLRLTSSFLEALP